MGAGPAPEAAPAVAPSYEALLLGEFADMAASHSAEYRPAGAEALNFNFNCNLKEGAAGGGASGEWRHFSLAMPFYTHFTRCGLVWALQLHCNTLRSPRAAPCVVSP